MRISINSAVIANRRHCEPRSLRRGNPVAFLLDCRAPQERGARKDGISNSTQIDLSQHQLVGNLLKILYLKNMNIR